MIELYELNPHKMTTPQEKIELYELNPHKKTTPHMTIIISLTLATLVPTEYRTASLWKKPLQAPEIIQE